MASAVDQVKIDKPYVVILGAGASRQAFPQGDRNGKLVPVMNELFDLPEIQEVVDQINVSKTSNFEDFYSKLSLNPEYSEHLRKLEKALYQYFSSLEIPDYPTLYDYLLLSLRKTDIIATFNWDPFIVQAHRRVRRITDKLPTVFFLHGTVALGRCEQDYIVDRIGNYCPKCHNPLKPLQLLYPITEKDYSGQFIEEQWEALQHYLKLCNGMTIFGYDAPVSDTRAIQLLENAWGGPEKRIMEEIDIINIKSRESLRESWKGFIHQAHYAVFEDYFDSSLANFPRRINEYQFMRFHAGMWLDNHKIKSGLTFSELKEEFQILLKYE